MLDIRDVKLEFLRHGPAHNQLLSPLTTYLALCGADGPASVNVPFEHHQLMNRLNRLRYEINGVQVEASQRQAELREFGEDIARMLCRVPAIGEITRCARSALNQLLNIRLVISANELSLLPFEATMAPDLSGSSGAPMLLSTLTAITREIRRGQPLPLQWNRRPRILFAFASPAGFPPVPAQEHLEALRRAIDPWVKRRRTQEMQIKKVESQLTVLENASIKMIRDACLMQQYTHVHILAHGAPMQGSQDLRYGVMLASDDGCPYSVVDGASLAYALKGLRRDDQAVEPPSVVTLATCDSGNAGSVVAPGGSIAHELHSHGVPWVIASQFPLWMDASIKATEVLYSGLLHGRDPRLVMYETRQRLRVDHPDTHDWASLVAYAAFPPDFDVQVCDFRSRQTRRRMNTKFDRMDELILWKRLRSTPPDSATVPSWPLNDPGSEDSARLEINALVTDIRHELQSWVGEPAAQSDVDELVDRLGMQAAAEKRIAIAWQRYADGDGPATEMSVTQAYEQSRKLYRRAMLMKPASHWVTTQYLSLSAVCAARKSPAGWRPGLQSLWHWWKLAQDMAHSQVCQVDAELKAWSHATLAELELLSVLYPVAEMSESDEEVGRRLTEHCRTIVELCSADSFTVKSTARQFERYCSVWSVLGLSKLASLGLEALRDE